MKNKAFTLIELLAVIVILAIIALIATPIILGIINNTRDESNKRSIELYASAVKNAIAEYQLTESNPPKTFIDLNIEYDGDIECRKKELYEDGSFYLEGCKVNKSEKEYSYGIKQVKPCTLEDLDGDGVASLSDIVTCGTESFYVMTNENNEITMLSKYNLDVGYIRTYTVIDNTILITTSYEPIENPTNKQSELVKEYIDTETYDYYFYYGTYYGTVEFSSELYWQNYWLLSIFEYPAYIYNDNSTLYPYVTEYERILKDELKVKSAQATLISLEQLEELGCISYGRRTCGPDDVDGDLENPAPEWVYSTSYWTGSVDSFGVWAVTSKGYFDYNPWAEVGVRPVVTISTAEI